MLAIVPYRLQWRALRNETHRRMQTGNATSLKRSTPHDMTANPIVRVDNVSKTYGSGAGSFTALQGVSLSIARGGAIALLGRSGSGKSTLLNLLGGVDRPTTGSVNVADADLARLDDRDLALFRRRQLGFVFQSFHLLPSLTVFDNVSVPWVLDRALTSARRREIDALLSRLGLVEKRDRYPDELSGGQQQRVALARAVIHRPRLVLADEPTGNLDAHSGQVILDLLLELRRDFGTTVVLATHSREAAARCEERILLDDGRVVEIIGGSEG